MNMLTLLPLATAVSLACLAPSALRADASAPTVVTSGIPEKRAQEAQEAQESPGTLEAVELGSTPNVHRLGQLWFSGQFPAEDLAALGALGIQRVITARTSGELDWDERAAVEAAGLQFVDVGFRAPETLTDELIDSLREALRDTETPTLFHCGSANRVGGAWIPFRVLDQGVPLEQAVAEARVIGLRTDGYRDRAVAYIEARSGELQREPSVREGLNDNFKDPELEVSDFIARFEVESREVYAARHAIVRALELEPGMRVADVGAGTGLYTFLLSEEVGSAGWVFALDIAPRFVQHILKLADERAVTNVTGVLCPERSTGLPPASVDLAYVCDVYHHFEFPASTNASLYRTLVPGGRLVVLDFERIPGQSREWTLEHVRAGKEVFRAEVEAAGFVFVRELEIEGLEENYALEFQKPAQ